MSAAEVIATQGVSHTTLSEVLEAAHITKGALYFHFASKDDLILGVEAEYQADSRAMIERIELGPETDPLRRLVLLSFETSRRYLRNTLTQAHHRLVLARIAPELYARLPDPPLDWAMVLRGYLAEADSRGLLAEGLDLDQMSELVDDCLFGTVVATDAEIRRRTLFSRLSDQWRVLLLPALVADARQRKRLEDFVTELLHEQHERVEVGPAKVGPGGQLAVVTSGSDDGRFSPIS